jgi:hypothetical protein
MCLGTSWDIPILTINGLMLLLVAKFTFSLAFARSFQGTGGAPTNHKLSNQTLVNKHELFYISNCY